MTIIKKELYMFVDKIFRCGGVKLDSSFTCQQDIKPQSDTEDAILYALAFNDRLRTGW